MRMRLLLNTNKFTPKVLTMMMAAISLSACQSVSTQTATVQNTGVIPNSASVMFADSDSSPSARAKAEVINAIKAHLASEHFMVSTTYMREIPVDDSQSVDAGAQSAFNTLSQVEAYREKIADTSQNGYRDYLDYIYDEQYNDAGDLPYLRYDDEMAGNDVQTVTRTVGMSGDYQEVSSTISSLEYQAKDCVDSASGRVDSLLRDNPNATSRHADYKAIMKDFNGCVAPIYSETKSILAQAQGYQIQDANQVTACLSDFKRNLTDIMNPSRTPKALSDEAYNNYDVIYENYRVCAKVSEVMTLEPYYYIDANYNEKTLQLNSQIKQCDAEYAKRNQALYAQGFSYKNHADMYAQSYYEYAMCGRQVADDVKGESSDELPPIDNLSDAKDIRYQLFDTVYDTISNRREIEKYKGVQGFIQAYKDIKTQNLDIKPNYGSGIINGLMLSQIFKGLKNTPEQVLAKNIYQNNYNTITVLSHHQPNEARIESLLSMDNETPTLTSSIQLPWRANFKDGTITADLSAALPVVALITPERAPLPNEVPNGQVLFDIPSEFKQKIPSVLIYESIKQGVVQALSELPREKFTRVDIRHDDYAKEIGATTAVKIGYSPKEIGKFYAVVAKRVGADLKAYVDAHPQFYPDGEADGIKRLIDDFALINTGYRTDDVGGLLSLIDAILPISVDASSYVYLDAQGNMIGNQTLSIIKNGLTDINIESVSQVRFGKANFDKNPFAQKFYANNQQSVAVNGREWLSDAIRENRFKKQAREVRYGYGYGYGYSDAATAAAAAAVAAAAMSTDASE